MGIYLNPGNDLFEMSVNSKIYVDKSMLINMTNSALNMYHEFSINDSAPYSEYMGFTENETYSLCNKYALSFDEMKDWYNGYLIDDISIYNPQSVVLTCNRKIFSNYWTKTESFEALKVFIQLDMDGLRQSIIKMIAGKKIKVNTEKFENDMVTFKSAVDVITLLIHLGYLTYSKKTGEAWDVNSVRSGFKVITNQNEGDYNAKSFNFIVLFHCYCIIHWVQF